MPSRRHFLAAATGLPAATSLAGCLSDFGLTRSGYLQLKGVSVAWRHSGRRFRDEVLFATADGESRLRGRIAREYASIVDAPRDVRVSESLAGRLRREFVEVGYVLGFCWNGSDGHTCRNARTSRGSFNRVQFGDRAEVVFESPGVEVVDVYERAQGDPAEWEVEVTRFGFAERHADDGVPIAGRSTR